MTFALRLPAGLLALLAGCGTWLVTALGAAAVFFFSKENERLMTALLGFAAGVMLAASYWSLLAPAIALAAESRTAFLAAQIGTVQEVLFESRLGRTPNDCETELLPDCEICFDDDPIGPIWGTWRYKNGAIVPRYKLLHDQIGYTTW